MVKFIQIITCICFIFTYTFAEDIISKIISNTPEEDFIKISLMKKNKENQNNIENKIVSFSGDNISLKMILYAIFSNTKYNVIFSPEVDSNTPITLNIKDTPLDTALETIMEIANLSYELKDNVIIIKDTEKRIYRFPYVKTISSYKSSLGGSTTGGRSGGSTTGGGSGGVNTTGNSTISGDFKVNYKVDEDVNDIFKQIEENISNLLSDKGKLVLNKSTGILIVEDKRDRLKLIEEYLTKVKKELDKQVLIEAKIVEVSLNDNFQYGIDWNILLRNIDGGKIILNQTLSLANSAASLAVVSSDINSLINILSQTGELKTLSNPRILVLNNQSALITSGNVVPYWTKQVNIVGGTVNTQPYSTVTYTQTNILDGIALGVIPHIEDDGSIILNIVPISTTIIGEKQIKENNTVIGEAPILAIKESGTIVRAKSGDVVIIGGLIDKLNQELEEKVPGLGDIPILGYLFKQKKKYVSRKELIIFMKVTKVNGGLM